MVIILMKRMRNRVIIMVLMTVIVAQFQHDQ